jgi:hypothetical protein
MLFLTAVVNRVESSSVVGAIGYVVDASSACRVGMLSIGLIIAAGCGGRTPLNGVGDPAGASVSGSGDNSGKEDRRPTAAEWCGQLGERRTARPDEKSQYCVCHDDGRWVCFGPSPDKVERTQVRCASLLAQPPHGDPESCLSVWSNCSNGRVYGLSCIDGSCACLVNNAFTAELEPRATCPRTLEEMNADCGWKLAPN